ncbi:MAG: SDR family oxidoreductase [Acidimicrobiales bacterium]|nr:SDR family oxidoreductase [Acidimicrobiales bacterium]
MSLSDSFLYAGKRVLVVGGASGMGAATAELVKDAGADVVVMDVAESKLDGATFIKLNLAEKDSIDAALAELGDGKLDALFSCAGVADGTPGIERINFVGHRYLIDRLVEKGALGQGSAIGAISSAAGLGWEPNLESLRPLLEISDYDEGAKWLVDSGKADYFNTKQALCAYVATQAYPLMKKGIRINAICPGPTDTPLAQANKEMWLGFGADYREEVGIEASTPLEQAYPLVFLCSAAAGAISGITLVSDGGYFAAGRTDAYPPAADIAKFLLGLLS